MGDLHGRLRACLQGRVCLMGLGSVELGDDAFGVRLAEALARDRAMRGARVVVAGTSPDRWIGRSLEGIDHLVFLDAVDFGAAPGALTLLSTEEMESRFPQISTHRLSLGLLARWAEGTGVRAWLLGVQPESLQPGRALSTSVRATLDAVVAVVRDTWRYGHVGRAQPLADEPLGPGGHAS